METYEAILHRRSVRKFLPGKIPDEIIQKILKAAMYAPSARNTQPWQFVVVTERELLDALMKVHPHAQMLSTATLAILVCGDKTLEPNADYLNTNCSAATQNLLLAAYDAGIASVWLGVYPRKERMEAIADVFSLPEHILPVSLVALGYADEQPPFPQRFLPERIHYNKW